MTAQPDLLPWNATDCCAEDKKRQGLKLQGGNTAWSGRGVQLCLKEEKRSYQGFFASTPSSPSRSVPLTATVTHDTHAHTYGSHQKDGPRCFERCHAHIWALPLQSPVPAVVPVLHHSQIRTTSGPQALNLTIKTRTLAVTNSTDPEGGPLIQPNRFFFSFLFCGLYYLKGVKPAATVSHWKNQLLCLLEEKITIQLFNLLLNIVFVWH